MTSSAFTINDDFPAASYAQWREMVEASLDGAPFEKKLVTRTYEGIPIQPLYTKEQWPAEGDVSGFPGQAPFVRGSRSPEASTSWDIRQLYRNPSPERTNQEILRELQRGVTSMILRWDRAARYGLDGDDAQAEELAGADGVMLYCREDVGRALNEVRSDMAPVALEAGSAFLPAAAMMIATWQKQNIDLKEARGNFGADPLGEIASDGLTPGSIDTALRRMAALARWTSENLPNVTTVHVNTGMYHSAGASAVLDISYAVATGLVYLKKLVECGMDIESAAKQITFSFSMGTNFFRGIAKIRAARRLWARIIEACGGSPEVQGMRIHVRTSRRVMTQYDPWVNILRATATTFAAAVGGAESITTAPFDQELGISDEPTRRLARNTQIILQEESHLSRVVDPGGGSWFIEKITEEFAETAWKKFQEIEAAGGMTEALTSGKVAEELAASYEVRAKNLSKRKDAVTGISEFPNLNEKLPARETPDYGALRHQAAEELAVTRGTSAAREATSRIKRVLEHEDLIPRLIEAAHAGSTVGQMLEALEMKVDRVNEPLPMRPLSEPFEMLRERSDRMLAKLGKRPQAFLANLGPIAHHTVRSTWSRNFLEAGGVETLTNKGFPDAAAAAEAFKESGAHIAVVCSSDKIYADHAEDTARALKAAGAATVILAGRPADEAQASAYKEAGVDEFIFLGCDVTGILENLLKQEGSVA